jgi:outer membrane beta-barrel protein
MKTTLLKTTVLALTLLVASTALAERRNPLEGQPAVRHRHELRASRFEIGPSFGFSVNRSLRQSITFGLKLAYHLSDWFSVGADFGYGIGIDTGLTSELERQYSDGSTAARPSCPLDKFGNPACGWDQLKERFSDVALSGDIRFAFTPISGKLAIFSKLFISYDLYAFAGLGLAILKNNFETTDKDHDGVSSGFRAGPAWGFGMHMYFTKFFSVGVETKDLIYLDNETGDDHTRGLGDTELSVWRDTGKTKIVVNSEDSKLLQHWYVGINFTFFLPIQAVGSR